MEVYNAKGIRHVSFNAMRTRIGSLPIPFTRSERAKSCLCTIPISLVNLSIPLVLIFGYVSILGASRYPLDIQVYVP